MMAQVGNIRLGTARIDLSPAGRGKSPAGPDMRLPTRPGAAHANRPWQCLYFLPEPHGQGSLRPTLPHDFGSLGLRCAERAAAKPPPVPPAPPAGVSASAISSSPVAGSTLCASM